MTRKRQSRAVRSIRQRAQDGLYRMSEHALLEMDEDELSEADVISTIVKGKLKAKQGGDPRDAGTSFEASRTMAESLR